MITYRMRYKQRGFNFTEACVIDIGGGGGVLFLYQTFGYRKTMTLMHVTYNIIERFMNERKMNCTFIPITVCVS